VIGALPGNPKTFFEYDAKLVKRRPKLRYGARSERPLCAAECHSEGRLRLAILWKGPGLCVS